MDGSTDRPSLAATISTGELYRLDCLEAQAVVDEVRAVVRTWKEVAGREGLGRFEVQRMESVFQH